MALGSPNIYAFRSRFHQFENASDGQIQIWLDLATRFISPSVFEDDYEMAVLYWSAHMLTLQLVQQANNTIDETGMADLFVSNISFGERSVSFSQRSAFGRIEEILDSGEALLPSTQWGQVYLALRRKNVISVVTV